MAQSDLDLLIKDFSTLNTQRRMTSFLKPHLDNLIVEGLALMGVRTIGDTNQAKSIFVDIARNEFKRDISWIYDVPTDLWGNIRGEGLYDGYTVTTVLEGGYQVHIEMRDDGLYGQEYYGTSDELEGGHIYPSPSRMGSQYEPRHLSNSQDDIDDGKIERIEAILDEIENLLVDRFEGRK